MTLSNDAFALWATYQHQPGWQEIGTRITRGDPQNDPDLIAARI